MSRRGDIQIKNTKQLKSFAGGMSSKLGKLGTTEGDRFAEFNAAWKALGDYSTISAAQFDGAMIGLRICNTR